MKLTANDRALMKGVHPDLVRVIERAAEITTIPFKVTEGLRSIARQKANVAKGVSWTMNSRHLTGHAVDVVPLVDLNKDGRISAAEQYSWPLYYKLAPIIKRAAQAVNVPVEWGGDWRKNKDGPHWQLPFKQYPVNAPGQVVPKEVAKIAAAHPLMSPQTEQGASKQRAVLAGSGGTATGVSVGGPQLAQVAIDAATGQQMELSSGDIARIVVAAVIVIASIAVAIYFYRRAHNPT